MQTNDSEIETPTPKTHWVIAELNDLKREVGVNALDLAEKAEVHVNSVRRLLRGDIDNFSFTLVESIADQLGYDVELIWRGDTPRADLQNNDDN